MNNMLQRRRALLKMRASVPKNGFVLGTYGIYTVVNRNTIRSATAKGAIYIPLREAIIIKSGDVLSAKIVHGEMPNITGSAFLTTNKSTSPKLNIAVAKSPPLDNNLITVTASANITANYFAFYINSGSTVEHEYSIGLWLNGRQLI